MKALFVLWRPKYLQNYEPTVRVLAERGHRIHFTFTAGRSSGGSKRFSAAGLERLARDFPGAITWDDDAPERDPADGWVGIAQAIRAFGDYARYVHPRYRDAPLLRERVVRRYRDVVPLAPVWPWHGARLSDLLLGLARDAERAVPSSTRIEAYLRELAPDLVLVTPLVDVASTQPDWLKSATALGIPAFVGVASWDNLTNKGVIRSDPDAVFVWNEAQRREAIDLHGVEPERVLATGAPKFDELFERRPTLDAAAFAGRVGLDPAQPFLLYVCSSYFIAPDEVGFVERWLAAVRRRLPDVGVLVRPHPENAERWRDVDLSRFGNVAVHPRAGAAVVDEDARADFFHSLAHSAAVVGVNTSALIEAAIVGKGVYTVLDPQFSGTQEGTLHFRHLLREHGGVLHVARSLDEHVVELAAALGSEPRLEPFVESFVRPHGLDRPAAPILADELERLAAAPARLPVETPRSRALHALLAPAAAWQRRGAKRPPDRIVAKQAELLLAPLRRQERVVLGPWLRDPVEEALYWIPYLRHLVDAAGLDRSRLVAVSHGRVGAWYEDVCGSYVDLEDLLGAEETRAAVHGRAPERARATEAALAALGVPARATVPPSQMRRVFAGYRSGRAPLGLVLEFTRLGTVASRTPGGYVAVEPGLDLPGARAADGWETIAGASLFVGRAGGLGLLGPALGVDTVVVVGGEDDRPEPDVDLCAWTAQRLEVPLTLLQRGQLGLLSELAGTLTT